MAQVHSSTQQFRQLPTSTSASKRLVHRHRALLCRATSSSSRRDATTAQQQQHEVQQQDLPQAPQQLCQQRHLADVQQPLRLPVAAAGVAGAAALLAAAAAHPEAASALTLHAEPSNALSLPTWAIHVSSVTEWVAAMALFWKYAEVTGNQRWKGMTWGMMPSLGSAMAACTWHFFYNSPELDFLVALQAFLTVVGNCTLWWAAWRVFTATQAEQASS